MYIVMSAKRPPACVSSWITLTASTPPLAPIGWPIAMQQGTVAQRQPLSGDRGLDGRTHYRHKVLARQYVQVARPSHDRLAQGMLGADLSCSCNTHALAAEVDGDVLHAWETLDFAGNRADTVLA
jgi:hypothetical protein